MITSRLALALLAVVASGCGGESGSVGGAPGTTAPLPPTPPVSTPPVVAPPVSAPASTEREIAPATTNAAIVTGASTHVVTNPDPLIAAKGRLFVMLPGTGGTPRNQRLILRTGPPRGYHAIGLAYPNEQAINGLCATSPVDDCTGLARREVITGEDTSSLVAVDAANSIGGRLTALLIHLHRLYPTEGWGQYLVEGRPTWSSITVAGHSQGGGHAAYMAKLYLLDRSVMFSSPGDTGAARGTLAPWLGLPNVTPAARQYGFTHTADELVAYNLAIASWQRLGLDAFGQPVSVDGAASGYGGSHQLVTSAPPNPASTRDAAAHGATVVDAPTPLTAQGEPLYRPVWIYLAFP